VSKRRPRSLRGPADLLLCQQLGMVLDEGLAEAFGYRRHNEGPRPREDEPVKSTPRVKRPAPSDPGREDLRALIPDAPGPEDPVFWVGRLKRRADAGAAPESAGTTIVPGALGESDLTAHRFPYLSTRVQCHARLADIFKRSRESRGVNLRAAVARVSRNEPLNRLPRSVRPGAVGEIFVLVDGRATLWPLLFDYERVVEAIAARWGRDLTHRIDLPGGIGKQWLSNRYTGPADLPPEAQLVLLSDIVLPDLRLTQRRALRRFVTECRILGHRLHHWRYADVAPRPKIVDALVAAMSTMRFPSPQRLRALRLALSANSIEASVADEIAAWNHADRDARRDSDWCLREGFQDIWSWRFATLEQPLRDVLLEAMASYGARLPPELRCLEQMHLARHGLAPRPPPDALLGAADALSNDPEGLAEGWWIHSIDSLRTVADAFAVDPAFAEVYRTAQHIAREHSLAFPGSHWADGTAPPSTLSLVQTGEDLAALADPGPRPVLYGSNGPWRDGRTGVMLHEGVLASGGESVTVHLPEATLRMEPLTRPSWAEALWKKRDVLYASHSCGALLRRATLLEIDDVTAVWTAVDKGPDWVDQVGVDGYGFWAEFTVEGVNQRLRWIPPGRFEMGSPEEEEAHQEDETQHQVTLTAGYWLAETACTQGLWEAVTGVNPSYFKGADRPVEQVNWDAVQGFVKGLNERLPDLHARLPTEAEWEYAARAGTRTAFWWGNELTTDRANYNGNYPYPEGGKRGEYREETLKVKTFEANPWGLYQVHGNVFEWCQDQYGEYSEGEQVNPKGPEAGVRRVLRGGSWNYYGQYLRAAFRFRDEPDYRYYYLGFRLAAGQFPGAEPR